LNFEEFLRVFNCLIDRWLKKLRVITKIGVDLLESQVLLLDSIDDFSLSHLKFRDLLVEVNLEFVD
jgi:hypothetical protein